MTLHSIFSPVLLPAPLQTSDHVPRRPNSRSKYVQHWTNMKHQKSHCWIWLLYLHPTNCSSKFSPNSTINENFERGHKDWILRALTISVICLLSFPGTHTFPQVTCGGRTWMRSESPIHALCVCYKSPHKLYNLGFITKTIKKGCT